MSDGEEKKSGEEKNAATQDKPKKKKRSPLPFILIIAGCAVVLTIALVNIIRTQMEYGHSAQVTNDAIDAIVVTEAPKETGSEQEKPFRYDHQAALAKNPDAKGLIFIPANDLKLPIVQKLNDASNEYYLHRGFDGEYSRAGTVYIDTNIKDGLDARHVILYGHHMGDGTMFSDNDKYRDADYYKEAGHDVFYIYTPDSVREYKIFSIYTPEPTGDTYTLFGAPTETDEEQKKATDKQFGEYVEKWKKYSFYDTGVDVSNAKQVVTLSSCDINTGYKLRLVVQGVLVNETKV